MYERADPPPTWLSKRRIIDVFAPPDAAPAVRPQVELVLCLCLFGVFVAAGFAVYYGAVMALWRAVLFLALVAVLTAIVPFTCRWTGGTAVAGNVLALLLVSSSVHNGLLRGGLAFPDLVFEIIAPWVTFFLCGRRTGWIWTGVALVTYFVFWARASAGQGPSNFSHMPTGVVLLLDALSLAALTVMGSVVAWAYERSRNAASHAQQRAAERLRLSQRLESVGQLAGGVAHDFNNILSVIIGTTSLLRLQVDPSDKLQGSILDIENAATRAANLTRQLLLFSRKEIIRPTVLDLNQVIHEAEKLITGTLREDITLDLHFAGGLWLVKADRGQVEQVLVNLTANARDAMPQGGTLILATTKRQINEPIDEGVFEIPPGRYVQLAVTDDGTGMSQEVAERALEPFFTTKDKHTGTGLGLATTYGIVKKAGGFIHIKSKPGRGTTITILLPVTDEPLTAELVQSNGTTPGDGETILVVEDDEGVRRVTKAMLSQSGYQVQQASDAEQALAILGEVSVDLILTDVVLPGMSGGALAEAVTQRHPGIQVLFMSGYAMDSIARLGVLDTNVRLLTKPFTEPDLLNAVRDALDS